MSLKFSQSLLFGNNIVSTERGMNLELEFGYESHSAISVTLKKILLSMEISFFICEVSEECDDHGSTPALAFSIHPSRF